jgi:hypothetical protein
MEGLDIEEDSTVSKGRQSDEDTGITDETGVIDVAGYTGAGRTIGTTGTNWTEEGN